jgi:very-short-patch-repair endonuclease
VDVVEVLAAAADRQGVLSRQELRCAGVSDAGLSRALDTGRVVRVRRRVYALAPLPAVPRFLVTDRGVDPRVVPVVRAALLELGPATAAAGRTAAVLRGWGVLTEPRRAVDVVVPHGHDCSPVGVRPRQTRDVRAEDVVPVSGLAPLLVTTAVQTVLDCALTLPRLDAAVVADSALRAGDVKLDELREAVARLPGRREAARARRVVEGCDPECGSVLESVQRVRMVLAGLDGFATQVVLRAAPVLRVDFCFAAARLVVEVDGARWHPDPTRDRRRDNALAALGWRVLRFTWNEVVRDSAGVVATVRAALDAGCPAVHLSAQTARDGSVAT